MYVGLFVRDECERSVKNQTSKDESVESWQARKKQPVKKPHVKHMTGGWRVMLGCEVCECCVRRAIPQNTFETLYLAKSLFALPNSLSTLYIPSLPTNCETCFQRENPRKYTWELEIVIPTIIYTFLCGFSQTPTSPSLHPWEIVSPNTYQLILSVKWDFGAIGKHWKESFIGRCNRAELWDLES